MLGYVASIDVLDSFYNEQEHQDGVSLTLLLQRKCAR